MAIAYARTVSSAVAGAAPRLPLSPPPSQPLEPPPPLPPAPQLLPPGGGAAAKNGSTSAGHGRSIRPPRTTGSGGSVPPPPPPLPSPSMLDREGRSPMDAARASLSAAAPSNRCDCRTTAVKGRPHQPLRGAGDKGGGDASATPTRARGAPAYSSRATPTRSTASSTGRSATYVLYVTSASGSANASARGACTARRVVGGVPARPNDGGAGGHRRRPPPGETASGGAPTRSGRRPPSQRR